MKVISHKTSARQRNPIPSLGSDRRVKAMRRVGITQLTGTNPVWWIDYSQTRVAEGTPIDAAALPQRKAVSWAVSGPAARAAWTSDGLAFAGAQSYSRGSGNDINGETQLAIISVTNITAAGQIVETHSGGFYTTRGILQGISATPVFIQSEGPLPTNLKNYEASFNEKIAYGTYWDTANPIPANTLLGSTNGQTAIETVFTSNPKGTAFASNNLFLGSRGSSALFIQGTMKVVIFFSDLSLSQVELNNLTRIAQWSVK
jgi:hypothetical protein